MAKTEKSKNHNFLVLNVILRKKHNREDCSESEYIQLFKKVHADKIHSETTRSKHGIIKSLFENKEDNRISFLSGLIAQFTFIDNSQWFDLKTLDLDEDFKVRDDLFPDAKLTEWVFVPSAHRFAYRVDSKVRWSPYPIRQFLEKSLSMVVDDDKYVEVHVETDRKTIDNIINAQVVKSLKIDVSYSNFDTGSDSMKFFEDDMKGSGVGNFKCDVKRKPENSIDVNKSQIIRGALESSVSNGEVEAKIIDSNGNPDSIKTKDFPLKERVYGTMSRFNDMVKEKIIAIFRNNG